MSITLISRMIINLRQVSIEVRVLVCQCSWANPCFRGVLDCWRRADTAIRYAKHLTERGLSSTSIGILQTGRFHGHSTWFNHEFWRGRGDARQLTTRFRYKVRSTAFIIISTIWHFTLKACEYYSIISWSSATESYNFAVIGTLSKYQGPRTTCATCAAMVHLSSSYLPHGVDIST